MEDMLSKLKEYFATTPREKVEADWAASKEATKGIKSPTLTEFFKAQEMWQSAAKEMTKHTFKVWTTEEVMADRSNVYQFLDFGVKKDYTEDNELDKGC